MQLAATSSATAQAITHLSDEKFATAKQISSLEEDCGYPLAPWGRWVVREGPGGAGTSYHAPAASLTAFSTALELSLRSLKEELASLRQRAQASEADALQDVPSLRIMRDLYQNITNIRWYPDDDAVRGCTRACVASAAPSARVATHVAQEAQEAKPGRAGAAVRQLCWTTAATTCSRSRWTPRSIRSFTSHPICGTSCSDACRGTTCYVCTSLWSACV